MRFFTFTKLYQIVTVLKALKHFIDIMNIKKTHVFFGGHLKV